MILVNVDIPYKGFVCNKSRFEIGDWIYKTKIHFRAYNKVKFSYKISSHNNPSTFKKFLMILSPYLLQFSRYKR